MFFVVDVETSGLTPWTGSLLSIGIQAVSEERQELVGDVFYKRICHNVVDPETAALNNMELTDTMEFWKTQYGTEAYKEAFLAFDRITHKDLRIAIGEYVSEIEPNKAQRFIAANPVAFDKMWLESIYGNAYDKMWPFHYRCLCLRSMRYGLEPEFEFGSRKGAQEPMIPHHAMYDAISEAQDLIYLLGRKEQNAGRSRTII